MNIAIIFGKNAPDDGNGLVDLGEKLKSLGHSVSYFHCDDYISDGFPFDVYIGHSFGGDKAMETIQKWNLPVRYLALIDPVKKGWFPFFWLPAVYFTIPGRVQMADCFKRKNGWLPPSSSIRNPSDHYENFMIESSHGDAPRSSVVIDRILFQISRVNR